MANLVCCFGLLSLFWVICIGIFTSVFIFKRVVWCLLNVVFIGAYCALACIRRSQDQWAFMVSVTSKLFQVALCFLFISLDPDNYPDDEDMMNLLIGFYCCFGGPALLASTLGASGLARIQLCGPLLAGLLGPGSSCSLFQLRSKSSLMALNAWANP